MPNNETFRDIVNEAKTRIKQETPEDALRRIQENKSARLVDVREDDEWREAHVEGAVHLGKGVIERDVDRIFPDKDVELHLYCGGGSRSALAADILRKMGYNNVYSVEGGLRAFKTMDVSIVKGDK